MTLNADNSFVQYATNADAEKHLLEAFSSIPLPSGFGRNSLSLAETVDTGPVSGYLASLGLHSVSTPTHAPTPASIVAYAAEQGITLGQNPDILGRPTMEEFLHAPVSVAVNPTHNSTPRNAPSTPASAMNPTGLPPKSPASIITSSPQMTGASLANFQGIMSQPGLVGSQTLSPEIMRMIHSQNAVQSAAAASRNAPWQVGTTTWPLPVLNNPLGPGQNDMAKVQESRERNREHSKKSRLRKKVFVEQLKVQVKELEMYKMITESCVDLITVIDNDEKATIRFGSSAYSRLLGIDPQELVGKSLYDFMNPEDISRLKQDLQSVGTFGEVLNMKHRFRSVDGKYHESDTRARIADQGITLISRLFKNSADNFMSEAVPGA